MIKIKAHVRYFQGTNIKQHIMGLFYGTLKQLTLVYPATIQIPMNLLSHSARIGNKSNIRIHLQGNNYDSI